MHLLLILISFINFHTRAGSPQQREPITVGPYYLSYPVNLPAGGNRSTRRKPTTFGRALTILFSHEDWVLVYLTGDRTRSLRGERRVVCSLHQEEYRSNIIVIFRVTFHCNYPNFVAKFERSSRSSFQNLQAGL